MPVEQKDIVLAVFGGAVGIAGLLLIFQGFIVGAYTSLRADAPVEIKRTHRKAVYGAFGAVGVAVLSIIDCLVWLLTGQGFDVVLALFSATLLAVLILGAFAIFYVVA